MSVREQEFQNTDATQFWSRTLGPIKNTFSSQPEPALRAPSPKLDWNGGSNAAAQRHHGRSCPDGPEAHLVNKSKFKPSQKPQPLPINCSCAGDYLITLSSADMLFVGLLNICQEDPRGMMQLSTQHARNQAEVEIGAASPAVRSQSCQAVQWLPSRWHTCY